jgi:predicted DNA-binding transcriptional regulator YafY
VVDAVGWGRVGDRVPHLAALREAVALGVQVRISYAKRGGEPTERVVHPYGLVSKGSYWYLVAGDRGEERTFRVSRIGSVEVTDLPADRPDGFDLDRSWQRTRRWVEGRRDYRVVLRADPRFVGILGGMFGARLETVAGPDADGRSTLAVLFPSAPVAAAELAGFAHGVEVLEPADVRGRLAEIGRLLLDRYG